MSGFKVSVEETPRMSGIKKAMLSILSFGFLGAAVVGVGMYGSTLDTHSNAASGLDSNKYQVIEAGASKASLDLVFKKLTNDSFQAQVRTGNAISSIVTDTTKSSGFSDFSRYSIEPEKGFVSSASPSSINIYKVNDGDAMARVRVSFDFDNNKLDKAKADCGNVDSEYSAIKAMAKSKFDRLVENATHTLTGYGVGGFTFAVPTNNDGSINQDSFDKKVNSGLETAIKRMDSAVVSTGHIHYSISGVGATKKIEEAQKHNPNALKEVAMSNDRDLAGAMAQLNTVESIKVAGLSR